MAAGGRDPPVLAAAAGMSHIQIPPGLTELLQGYTVEVLRRQPPDLVEFAVDYFTRLREARAPAARPPAAPPAYSPEPEPGPGPVADAESESEEDEDFDGKRRAGWRFAAGGTEGGGRAGSRGLEGLRGPRRLPRGGTLEPSLSGLPEPRARRLRMELGGAPSPGAHGASRQTRLHGSVRAFGLRRGAEPAASCRAARAAAGDPSPRVFRRPDSSRPRACAAAECGNKSFCEKLLGKTLSVDESREKR